MHTPENNLENTSISFEHLEQAINTMLNNYNQLKTQHEQLNRQYQAVKMAYTESLESNKKVESRIKHLLARLTNL
jgi:chromosome segregation ATPase